MSYVMWLNFLIWQQLYLFVYKSQSKCKNLFVVLKWNSIPYIRQQHSGVTINYLAFSLMTCSCSIRADTCGQAYVANGSRNLMFTRIQPYLRCEYKQRRDIPINNTVSNILLFHDAGTANHRKF